MVVLDRYTKPHGQVGFTLLEVLISVLVLSVGLLGVAAMQLKATQGAHVAYQRTVANMIAIDAHERLWIALGDMDGTCPGTTTSPSVQDVEVDWLSYWAPPGEKAKLPGLASSKVEPVAVTDCEYDIDVTWADERFLLAPGKEEGVSSLPYRVKLPEKP